MLQDAHLLLRSRQTVEREHFGGKLATMNILRQAHELTRRRTRQALFGKQSVLQRPLTHHADRFRVVTHSSSYRCGCDHSRLLEQLLEGVEEREAGRLAHQCDPVIFRQVTKVFADVVKQIGQPLYTSIAALSKRGEPRLHLGRRPRGGICEATNDTA